MLNTIKLNSTGDLVKVAQYLSKYKEINKATEIFDNDFKSYIIKWQKNNKLDADGIIGKNTWTALSKKALVCSTNKNTTSVFTCAIQILIGGIPVTGTFDTTTKEAVVAFQAARGLVVDGICGPKTWNALIVQQTSATSIIEKVKEVITNNKVLNNCVKYLQWDKKWKNIKYSTHTAEQTIGNSGCGPSSMAQIMATFIDPKITPVEMCNLALKGGYRTYNSGTAWGFFKYVFSKYDGFSKYIQTSSVTTLKAALKEGALAVCSMNNKDNNFWTTSGHFITVRGYDDTYIYANDPNKSTTPRKQATTKFQKCIKQAFIFWPKKEEPQLETNLNGKIIDISKHQGDIDFSKLKSEVSLIIARASCGSDKDIKIDEYIKEMEKYNIPYGVYCYSYAGTVEKAIDEANKMIAYMKNYKPKFYVIDAEEERLTTETITAFINELRKLTNKKVGCYVAHNRYKTYKYDTIKQLFDFTWIPRYGNNDGTISGATKPAYDCDLWQYTSVGKISGIKGNVDFNILINNEKPIQWFLNE